MEVGTKFKKKKGQVKTTRNTKIYRKQRETVKITRLRTMQTLKLLMDLQDFRQLPIIESVCPSTLS